jgi:hypothetical protein
MFNNTRIAVDDTDIYWADANNHIVRLSRNASPPDAATIFSPFSAVPRDLVELAVDATFVYWLESRTTSGRVVRVPKVVGGGAPLSWEVASTTNLATLRIDLSGLAYVLNGGTLTRLLPNPSSLTFTPQPIGTLGLVSQYVVDRDRVYWVESDSLRQHLTVKSAPLTDPTQVMEHWTITPSASASVSDMAVDDSNLYWIEFHGGREAAIMRMPRTGGNPVVLTSYGPTDDLPGQLVATAGYLFWSMGGSAQIRRMQTDAPGLDLKTDGIAPQAIQVVQGPGNEILLISGKPTFVRAFGRIDPASTGQTSIFVNPSATLSGSRDGQPLPGSPLMPLSNVALLTANPIDTRDTSNGLLFELPESWTHGTVTLEATINPAHTVLESDFSNNSASATVKFQDGQSACLHFVPIATESGTITGPSSTIMAFVDRAVSVYPLTELQVDFDGGPALRRPRLPLGIVQGSDPWKLDSDFELFYLLYSMWWTYSANTGYACLGASTSIAGPVSSAWRFGMSGTNVMTFLMRPGANPILTPYEGLAGIAHELGHQFGRSHIGCPTSGPDAPGFPLDGSYPHPPCLTDDNTAAAHLGFDGLLKQWSLPGSTADMMTYSRPTLWVSDYTYRGLADHQGLLTTLSAGAPLALANGEQRMLIGGVLGPQPLVGFAFPLDDDQALQAGRRLEGRVQASSEFELYVRDVNGATLLHTPVRMARIESEGGAEAYLFFNIVSMPNSAARLDVVAANGITLLSRTAGPAIPKVSITQPRKDTKIESTLKIAWNAADSDNDPLLFSVRYSPDRGKNWYGLASNVSERSLVVPTGQLAGGKEALIEVTVSDGLHSSRAVAGPFELSRHSPKALIYDYGGRTLGPQAPSAIMQSQALTLRGNGFDPEDGQLPASSLQWAITGPVAANAVGTRLRVDDLPPGRYMAALTVTDRDNNQTSAQAAITVLPKQVGESSESANLDGRCMDPVYARDADPMRLRFPQAWLVEARFVRVGGVLYVCLAGLPLPKAPSDYAGIRVRTLESSTDGVTENDVGFFVRPNGTSMTAHGTVNGSWSFDPSPRGLAAAAAVSDRSWSAELRIDVARLGGSDRQILIQAAQYSAEGTTSEGAWPRDSTLQKPRSWGAVIIGRVAQTIAFAPLANRVVALGEFDPAATASSGLGVEYSAGGACEVQGNRVVPRGTGACSVVASQPGNAIFTPARPVTRTFRVR